MDTLSTENKSVEELLGEVANEFFQQLEQGHRPKVEEYAQKHPEIAEQIRLTFPALELVGNALSSSDDAMLGAAAADRVGQLRLGDFQMVRELGRGGMGVVYEARQISMGRQVALKILPFAALADEMPLRRFKNEVRAVATLDHPNIVTVYSIGEESGVHYYAMQLIRGRSLAETIEQLAKLKNSPQPVDGDSISQLLDSCDSSSASAASSGTQTQKLGTTVEGETEAAGDVKTTDPEMQAALSTLSATVPLPEFYRSAAKLGIQAASALAHAHENGVLHRDIKPANLLLDACGNVYLTDFGLARIEADAGMTMTGQLIGTLRYMSPEQALAKRGVIDHRSDIYSLGMTLYELLALRPAFGSTSRQEILAQIAFEEPAKLRRLVRSIPAELETIIAKAIEKMPEDRYASAAELADDLRAFLDDRPITARPPTLVQRLGKWSRRNRGLVAASAVAGGICLVLLVVSNILVAGQKALAEKAAAGERTERQTAERERDAAQQARDQAEDVTTFLLDAFRSPNPDRDGHTVTVVEVLEQAVEKLDSRREMDSLRKAALLDAIGQTYMGLRLGREALPSFEQALAFRREQLGQQHESTFISMHNLASAYESAGRTAEAINLHEQTLTIRREVLGDRHPDTLTSMNNLALSYNSAGRPEEAVKLHEQTLGLQREVQGDQHHSTLNSMDNLASAYASVGRLAEAVELQEQSLTLKQEVLGDRHPDTLRSMNNLAVAYEESGRFAKAIELHGQTLSLQQAVFGDQHPDTLTSMNNLALAYKSAGRTAEAVELHEQTLTIEQAVLGDKHPGTLTSMGNLASAYLSARRFAEAVELLEQTLSLKQEVNGDRHPNTLTTMNNLASAYNQTGRFEDAIELAEQTLTFMREVLGDGHPNTLTSMDNLASAYNSAGRAGEAVELHEQTVTFAREFLGERHPNTLRSMNNLALAYINARRSTDAVEMQRQTLNFAREVLGEQHPNTLQLVNNFANGLTAAAETNLQMKQSEKAESLARELLELRERLVPEHWSRFHAQSLLGLALLQQAKADEAEQHLLEGFAGIQARRKTMSAEQRGSLLKVCQALVDLYQSQGNDEQAERWKQTLASLP